MTRLLIFSMLAAGALAIPGCGAADPKGESLRAGPGAFAREFIRGAPYAALRVEWDHAPGLPPSASDRAALDELQRRLLDKPGGVRSDPPEVLQGATSQVYDLAAIRALEEAHRSRYKDEATGEAALYVLALGGHYSMDTAEEKVLGLAYRASSLVLFAETIAAGCQGPGPLLCNLSRSTVLTHEVGHLLGLVNNGTPMLSPHQDTAHGAHDSNTECVMYYANNSGQVIDRLRQRILTGGQEGFLFDQACMDDIAAARR